MTASVETSSYPTPTRGWRDVLVVPGHTLLPAAVEHARALKYAWFHFNSTVWYIPPRQSHVMLVGDVSLHDLDELLREWSSNDPQAGIWDIDACRYCGCTEKRAWAAPGVCSSCDELLREIALQMLDSSNWASYDDLWKYASDHLMARRRVLRGETLTLVAGQGRTDTTGDLTPAEDAACDALEQGRTDAFRALRDVAERLLEHKKDHITHISTRETALLIDLADAVALVAIYIDDNQGEEDSSDRKAEGPATDESCAGDPKSSSPAASLVDASLVLLRALAKRYGDGFATKRGRPAEEFEACCGVVWFRIREVQRSLGLPVSETEDLRP